MKPLLLKVKGQEDASFEIRHEKVPFFDNPWHYHPELELNLIIKSEGTRFIGDSIAPFKADELVLLGSYIPHYWRNSETYLQTETAEAEAVIMRFKADMWGSAWLDAPEMRQIKALFQKAERGILFSKPTTQITKEILYKILENNNLEKIILWLQLFRELAKDEYVQLLSDKIYENRQNLYDHRLTKVLAYLQDHLKQPIDLETLADIANMNKSAFCRYFKQQTNKTFTEVIREMRIQLACQLLVETQDDINQIAFASGFEEVSYFNQVFKMVKNMNPSQFRARAKQIL